MSSDWGLGKSQGLTTHRRKDGQLQPQSQATITSRNARRHKKRSVAAVEEQQVQDTGGKQIAEEQHGDEQEDVVDTGGTPGTEDSGAGGEGQKSRSAWKNRLKKARAAAKKVVDGASGPRPEGR